MEQALHRVLGLAVRQILHPLVRMLLRAGVPCGTFVEQAKRVYVDVARGEFKVEGRKPSISRTAVITGLTRKEVSRLWKIPEETHESAVEKYNRAARVIAAWVRDPRYTAADGAPMPLVFTAAAADAEPSFNGLVAEASGDMPPRAVLDELIRVGAVEEQNNGRFRLIERAYIPTKGEEEKLGILGTDVAELLATIDHNLTCTPEDTRFQRKVLYDNLPVECLPLLRNSAAELSQALLETLDGQMSEFDRDANSSVAGSGRATAAVGIYFYQDASEEGSGDVSPSVDGITFSASESDDQKGQK